MSSFSLIQKVYACIPGRNNDCSDLPPELSDPREPIISLEKIADFANDHQILAGFIVVIAFVLIMTLVAYILKKYEAMRMVRRIVGLLFYTASVIPMLFFIRLFLRHMSYYVTDGPRFYLMPAWHVEFPGYFVFLGLAFALWFIGYIFRK
jgi:hypothetical protein